MSVKVSSIKKFPEEFWRVVYYRLARPVKAVTDCPLHCPFIGNWQHGKCTKCAEIAELVKREIFEGRL
ncbi:MAG: hypothetical protein XD69_0161 [Clostridia bacterium 62_21]|nr:MAG: hypothetical protein XD69_0161 [Clostridia bacterium 62_21]